MNPILTRLGVPGDVQAYFGVEELLFSYGDNFEHFDAGFHRVPTTRNLWLAGKEMTRDVIITSTAMEAIAFATFNSHHFAGLDSLSFIAIGNLPHPEQLNWISADFPKRKFTLVFGKDLLGRLADIKVATGLRQKQVRLLQAGAQVEIICEDKRLYLPADKLSLNTFEKMAGIRMGVRTCKPRKFDTFLDQLKHYGNQ